MDVLCRVLRTGDDDAAAAAVASFVGDINEWIRPEQTVLIEAIRRRLHRTISALGARGDCDVELVGSVLHPIHLAAVYGMVAPVVQAFPDVNVNRQYNGGSTALHFACRKAAMDDVKALLSHGADPTLCDYHGLTADVGVHPELAVEFRRLFARATGDRLSWMRVCISAVNAF